MKHHLLTIAACAGLLFASCASNEKTPGLEGGETKSAYLKIKTNTVNKGVRSDEPSQTGQTADLYNAMIYFVDGSTDPLIYDVITVNQTGTAITLTDLEEGVLIEDISSQVTQVYVIGNYNSSDEFFRFPTFPENVGQRLSVVQGIVLNIQQVSYGNIGTSTVSADLITVMDGQETFKLYDSSDNDWNGDNTPDQGDLYANVVLSPIVSRIEIVEIDYTGVLSFTLEGIYINNYFHELPLSLSTESRSPMNNGSVFANYDSDPANTQFKYRNYNTMYDPVGEPADGDQTFTPANGTWAYQVFGNSNPSPHIILKLTDVAAADGTPLDDLYLTVTGFRNGNDEISTLTRNTIYKINSLPFTDGDLSVVPEPETINVWVHVEVQPWRTLNVTPII